jgi:NAD(P)-dependent dehydrogenase (short-subunit alcohol dehydrogenase family)
MQRVAIVTGAGSGIGRAIAVRLAAAGYRLGLVGRRQAALRETAAICGGVCEVIPADLRDGSEAARVVDECVGRLGRIDVLVNNAGWSPPATIPQTTPEIASEVFALNAVAPCVSIARAWPHFQRQHAADGSRSVIASVSSMAVLDPFESLYAYAGAKSALHSFTLSASRQGASIGLRAFAIAPGAVETELLRTIVDAEHLPPSRTLIPDTIAVITMDCIEGRRDGDNGGVIWVPSP